MDTPDNATGSIQLDPSGRLDEDMHCLHCGYNLRGLDPQGACPECGTAIGRSTYGDLLRYCDPTWVEQLASGMNWIVLSIVLSLLIGVAVVLGGVGNQQHATLIGLAFTLVPGLASLVGYWKLTTPDPRGSGTEVQFSARAVARATAVLTFALSAVSPGNTWTPQMIVVAVGVVSTLLGIVRILAVGTYARQLAMRIPNQKLAEQTRTVMWGLVIVGSLAALVAATAFLQVSKGRQLAAPLAGVTGTALAGCFVAVGYLILGLWALRLIGRYRKAFRTAAAEARATWAAYGTT